MRWAFINSAKILLAGMICVIIISCQASAWSPNNSPEFQTSDVKVFHPSPCPGYFRNISVSGEGSINACVMGENTRIATYYPAQGGVAYAISFPSETSFYPLNVCGGIWGCVYAEENDTFMGLPTQYTHFVKNLSKSIQNGVIWYSPNEYSEAFISTYFGNLKLSGQTVAISKNGKWGLVEIKEYGFIRVNTLTNEVRRIIAPGISYGYGYDPWVEMAISNDGKAAAIMGSRMGIRVVMIDDTCGDHPTQFMQTMYVGAVTVCKILNTPPNTYTPDFVHAVDPRFSGDDKSLSFTAYSASTQPRRVTLFSDSGVDYNNMAYVALGDSFTSGEGELQDSFYVGGPSNRCHISSRSYPFIVANEWKTSVVSVACSGATIDTARGEGAKTNQPNQLRELETHPSKVTTIGIGGNDAGLIGKLKTCLGLDTCEWAASPQKRNSTAMEIKKLYQKLKDFYQEVRGQAQGVVIVVGYPRIISAQSQCASSIGTLLNQTERTFMNEAIHYLNQVIKSAASASGVEYVDVEQAFSGGVLCSSSNPPFMNGIRIGDDFPDISLLPFIKVIGAESFHPTPKGHELIAAKLLNAFPAIINSDECITCTGEDAIPGPSSYWSSPEPSPNTQRAASFVNKITIKKGDLFEISFPSFSFKPSSDITIELHSDVKHLGTMRSNEDGSASMSLQAADTEPGFHTIHALGKSFTGEETDTYDFIEIENDDTTIRSSSSASATTELDNKQSESKPSSRELNSANSGTVLGATAVNLPFAPQKVIKNEANTGSLPQFNARHTLPWLFLTLFALGAGIIGIGLIFYLIYRQKHSRK